MTFWEGVIFGVAAGTLLGLWAGLLLIAWCHVMDWLDGREAGALLRVTRPREEEE